MSSLDTSLFVLLELVAIGLNAILVCVLCSRAHYTRFLTAPTSTRTVLLALTTLDLIGLVFVVPVQFVTLSNHSLSTADWPFGSLLCGLLPAVQVTTFVLTPHLLAVLAVHWCHHPLVRPYKPPVSARKTTLAVLLLTAMAVATAVPVFFDHRLVFEDSVTVNNEQQPQQQPRPTPMCKQLTATSSVWFHLPHYIVLIAQAQALPLVICVYAYTRIHWAGCSASSSSPMMMMQHHWSSDTQTRHNRSVDRKMIRMLLTITVLYFALYLPIDALSIALHFSPSVRHVPHLSTVWHTCSALAECHLYCKPLVYWTINDHFRAAVRARFTGHFDTDRITDSNHHNQNNNNNNNNDPDFENDDANNLTTTTTITLA